MYELSIFELNIVSGGTGSTSAGKLAAAGTSGTSVADGNITHEEVVMANLFLIKNFVFKLFLITLKSSNREKYK